ncbi:MAG: hypothetical protein KF796_17890 [Ramlibacter sp.]|nr:hypothetical protein [Ramlibacter sp.]
MTPAQSLAASREAIARQLRGERPGPPHRPSQAGQVPDEEASTHGAPSRGGWWRLARRTLSIWWRHHPAHAAAQVARPALQAYAQDKPLQLIGVAASVGAAAVVLRPWRLISLGALVAATLKTSDLSTLLISLFSQDAPPSAVDRTP